MHAILLIFLTHTQTCVRTWWNGLKLKGTEFNLDNIIVKFNLYRHNKISNRFILVNISIQILFNETRNNILLDIFWHMFHLSSTVSYNENRAFACVLLQFEVNWMKDHLNINDVNFRNFLAFYHIEFYLKIILVDLDD